MLLWSRIDASDDILYDSLFTSFLSVLLLSSFTTLLNLSFLLTNIFIIIQY